MFENNPSCRLPCVVVVGVPLDDVVVVGVPLDDVVVVGVPLDDVVVVGVPLDDVGPWPFVQLVGFKSSFLALQIVMLWAGIIVPFEMRDKNTSMHFHVVRTTGCHAETMHVT